jgi:hypothetical protein
MHDFMPLQMSIDIPQLALKLRLDEGEWYILLYSHCIRINRIRAQNIHPVINSYLRVSVTELILVNS